MFGENFVIFLLISIMLDIVAAFAFREIVRMKGHSAELETTALLLCIFIPLAGWIYVAALPDRSGFVNLSAGNMADRTAYGIARGSDLPDL